MGFAFCPIIVQMLEARDRSIDLTVRSGMGKIIICDGSGGGIRI